MASFGEVRPSSYAADSRLTRSAGRLFSACQRSNCNCWASQLSALVSKASDSRSAIYWVVGGVIPARPLMIAERVLRLTPRPLAAAVTVSSSGSRQRAFSTSPGWGGL